MKSKLIALGLAVGACASQASAATIVTKPTFMLGLHKMIEVIGGMLLFHGGRFV